ncbi:RNA polymerase sigma-70 factor [Sphingobacterium spiritivorum ATCC 33300]|uniref:RNA polymerase sigma-70 factor n=1 Tax=Sphingobacterium spiritivorum ATCC 33300 TaxID=525372 RepID=C2FWS2_SPHSI|nr:RNA polymerase sigma-70 factor [Sphingobacterium spiritivorum]EEI92686.1 RNA polymerase sigma-70 factor [Sphingobacterium spiritivorum ATCC 33300]QQS94126.1 RNA polymerase sigma-70 factor [Sphingobacterium spiritivorum]
MKREPNEYIFKKYYPRLCHFAWKLLGVKSQAEDVVQDAFCTYFDQQENVSGEENAVKNFLYTAVRFSCYNIHRREKIQERYWMLNPIKEEEESQVEHSLIFSEVIADVYRVVAEMPKSCQHVFRMGYLEGLSNLEIAEKLDISINTVKTQKQRGMKTLLAKLDPELLAVFVILFSIK